MKNIMKMKFKHIFGIATITLPILFPSISVAQEEEVFDLGKYRIDIAGRQRMLTQRIAKAICFIELGQDVDMHHDMLERDYHLFDETLYLLRDGGGEHNLAAETDRRTLAELEVVFAHWEPFAAEIETIIATNVVTAEAEEHIIEENLIMLQDMNDTTTLIEQEYANPHTLQMAGAMTINIFARQRMLSQKAAKDFCYVATAHHVEETRKDLAETQALFAASLGAIMNGYEALGIAPPPSEEIEAQLEIVAEIWGPLDEIFTNVSGGSDPTQAEVALVATENIHLQTEMNNAVQLYVAH